MRAKLLLDQSLEDKCLRPKEKGSDTLCTTASPQPSRKHCRYGRFLNLFYGIQDFNKLQAMQPYFKPIDSRPVTHELLRTRCNWGKPERAPHLSVVDVYVGASCVRGV